jgi:NAD(P)-dependent dehydrogenase (short-subunit alcohol dehydrogenase family)
MTNKTEPSMVYPTYPDLAGKRVVITCGGGGIGAELVTAFLDAGWHGA